MPYRRLHKKGITEEIAKKRSRKTVKHQRGIVGADLASIAAKRNQSAQIRTAQRTAAIQKAKSEKKEKEAKKTKVCSIVCLVLMYVLNLAVKASRPQNTTAPKISKQQAKGGKGGR